MMRYPILLTLCFFSLRLGSLALSQTNSRPMVGILNQPTYGEIGSGSSNTYIAASYVKWVESGGARVVPVMLDLAADDLTSLLDSLNGLVLPGGGIDWENQQYANTMTTIWNYALTAFAKGDYFPMWGTCLGFEELSVVAAGWNHAVLSNLQGVENSSLALNFSTYANQSRMFSNAPTGLMNILATQKITLNNHGYGVTPNSFNQYLKSYFRIISTNFDTSGTEFVSTMEGVSLPIYATQWHPEKNMFEWDSYEVINHSYDAVLATHYLAMFFVNETRKSMHSFPTVEDQTTNVIYNFPVTYTGTFVDSPDFEQTYFFNNTLSNASLPNNTDVADHLGAPYQSELGQYWLQ